MTEDQRVEWMVVESEEQRVAAKVEKKVLRKVVSKDTKKVASSVAHMAVNLAAWKAEKKDAQRVALKV